MKDRHKNINVQAPEEWMNGWKKRYEDEADGDLTIVDDFVHYSINILTMLLKKENKNNQNILEFACGTGMEACYLATNGHNITAFDALPNAIELATKRAKDLEVSNKVKFSLDDMLRYQVKAEEYDVIVAIQCLQYLFDDAVSKFREILKGIKPGGYIVYSGNVLPHFPTTPPIRFIEKEELLAELDGWTIHSIANEERMLKENDTRGFVFLVAQKPINR